MQRSSYYISCTESVLITHYGLVCPPWYAPKQKLGLCLDKDELKTVVRVGTVWGDRWLPFKVNWLFAQRLPLRLLKGSNFLPKGSPFSIMSDRLDIKAFCIRSWDFPFIFFTLFSLFTKPPEDEKFPWQECFPCHHFTYIIQVIMWRSNFIYIWMSGWKLYWIVAYRT